MAKHKLDRIHWAKIYKIIKEEDVQCISVKDLAKKLGLKIDDKELEKTLSQLEEQKRIKMILGVDKEGVARVMVIDNQPENIDESERS